MSKSRTVLAVMASSVIAWPVLRATNSYDGTFSGQQSLTNGDTGICAGHSNVTIIITGSTLKIANSDLGDSRLGSTPSRMARWPILAPCGTLWAIAGPSIAAGGPYDGTCRGTRVRLCPTALDV